MDKLTEIRNKLYDNIPTGEIKAWDLLKVIKEHLNDLDKYIDAKTEKLPIHNVVGQSEQLKAFADYAQKRMWEDGNKDLSEFVDEFLSL